jgi:3D-(3,5/4)-trihydroxycyclohexane-1,2-dione acylhydrolase (decyclizing)
MPWLREADLVLAVGTRLQDFTTGSHSLFTQARILGLNVQPAGRRKWPASLVADAGSGWASCPRLCVAGRPMPAWTRAHANRRASWLPGSTELTTGHCRPACCPTTPT